MWQQAEQIFVIPTIQCDRFTIPTIDLSSLQLNITVTGTSKTERNTKNTLLLFQLMPTIIKS